MLFNIFGLPALAALASALILTCVGRRFAPPDHRGAFVLPVAVALAYFAGYVVLPRSFAALIPQPNQSWPALPYLGLVAATVSAIAHYFSKAVVWRLSVIAMAGAVAVVVAPTWPVYGLSRTPMVWLFVVYLLVVGIALQSLPERLLNRTFLGILTGAATLLALATGAMQSVVLAQLAAIAAAALAGSAIACAFGPRPSEPSLRSLVPVFVALVGGAAVVLSLEPDPPQLGLLAIPLLPLATWLMVAIPYRDGRLTV